MIYVSCTGSSKSVTKDELLAFINPQLSEDCKVSCQLGYLLDEEAGENGEGAVAISNADLLSYQRQHAEYAVFFYY